MKKKPYISKDEVVKVRRYDLARNVYESVYDATEVFSDDDIGLDLAYLLGAILKGGMTEWSGDRPLVKLLRGIYPPEHSVWKHIEVTAP